VRVSIKPRQKIRTAQPPINPIATHPSLAVIQRSAFRDEESLLDAARTATSSSQPVLIFLASV
jgi:hypothetical protein